MNSAQSYLRGGLLSLAEEKLKCLQALNASLHMFYNTMEDSDQDEILSQLVVQSALMDQINRIDEKFQAIREANLLNCSPAGPDEKTQSAECNTALDKKLMEQRGLLVEISHLNEKTTAKVQALSDALRQKIKAINQQRTLLSNLNLFDKNQTGNLYDFKEGKRL